MSRYHSRKVDYPERKPSVFERLGTKSATKATTACCLSWDENGTCPLGKTCKLAHTHFLINPKQKFENMKKGSISKKQFKDSHRRSRSMETPEPSTWDGWDFGDLEGADEKDLQKRRLQLQRELRLQLKREKDLAKLLKKEKKSARSPSSSSSSSSETTSSTSSSSGSSPHSRKRLDRKRKASPSSGSDDSPHRKKRKPSKISPKLKVVVKKKADSPRKTVLVKKTTRKSPSPTWDRRASPKRKSPSRNKSRIPSPKHKVREPSPRRLVKPKDRRVTPPRPPRARSVERRRHHSPRRRREGDRGGLEKGGKILPVKSSAYVKEMKESVRRKSADRLREEREKEREKEKRRREQKIREQAERRERERDEQRMRRETERQKEREEALERCRERQRERDRMDRIDRDKRIKDPDHRKAEGKNELPSLMDIKTEAPREQSRHSWEERRSRRGDDQFEFRRVPRDDLESTEERRGRKIHDYVPETSSWEGKEDFREPPREGEWNREWKHRYEQKWSGDVGSSGGRDRERESSWREHYTGRRPADWIAEAPPPDDTPRSDERASAEPPRRQVETAPVEITTISDVAPVERPADLEEVLSDISDDADDILNQDDEPVPEPIEAPPAQLPSICISQQGAEFFFDHRRPLLECLNDRGLDFEEISDEELEEEAKMSKGIMDVLGADWASLMKQTPVKTVKSEGVGTARRRWRVDSIIARIGFSEKLVGKEFAESYLAKIDTEFRDADVLQEDKQGNTDSSIDIKPKPMEDEAMDASTQDSTLSEKCADITALKVEAATIKEEDNVKVQTENNPFMLKLPGIHSALHESRGISAFQRHLQSKYRRALSARADLCLRRTLCGLSAREPQPFSPCDEKLYESSVALFKSAAA